MNLLDAFQNFGLATKKETASEWKAACPSCGGKDRCMIWPNHSGGTGGRFHCRQCGKTGDLVDFLQAFEGMSYQEACQKAGKPKISLAGGESRNNRISSKKSILSPARPKESMPPPAKWIEQAATFLSRCQTEDALFCPAAIEKIAVERFLPPDFCPQLGIGWHEQDEYMSRCEWGLDGDGKIRLPRGIVIGTRRKAGIVNLTIRTIDKDLPRYWQVAGGAPNVPYISKFDGNKPIFILESALDATLLTMPHEAGDICNAVALGGTCKGIDADTMAFIQAAPLIIASPDADEAGDAAIVHWQKLFPSAWIYRAVKAKDIGDMHKLAMSLDGHAFPTAGEWARHAIEYVKMRQKRSYVG